MILIEHCTKRYGDLAAVQDLSISIKESEILGLLGPNGAGKSTTIKMIVGLLKPDAGTIKIDGFDITQDPVRAKRVMAYVPEKSFLFNKLTAWQYLTFIGGLYGLDRDFFQAEAEKYLRLWGIFNWKDETIESFSFGMKQRLVLTSAFMRHPKVLILDEPHNGLDPKGIRLLKDMLLEMKNKGVTILFSTHIIAIAEQLCDKVVIINKGTVAAEGMSNDVKLYAHSEDKTLEDIFLRLTSDYEK
jgi:ABC-2 type transport system ATP-binding protein